MIFPSEKGFGFALIKTDGSAIYYDRLSSNGLSSNAPKQKETFWFEACYTKAEYAILAKALKGAKHPVAKQLREDFLARAKNGHGGGA